MCEKEREKERERERFEENKEQRGGKKTGEIDNGNIEFSLEHIMSEMKGWL